MKIKYRQFTSDGKPLAAYFVYCPACLRAHRFLVENTIDPEHVWTFNGSEDAPTFSPSLLVEVSPSKPGRPDMICHSFLEDGVWRFLSDSTHRLAGQSVAMVAFPEGYRV